MNNLYRFRQKDIIALFCLALVSLYGSIALAQVVSDAPVADPQPLIEVTEDTPLDSRIENRLENIFEKIDGLEGVTVSVNAGVVKLNGEVANEAMARNALDIAIRTSGVVTVADEINRTLDVGGNLKPLLNDFQGALLAFTRALPLILLALAIVFFFIVIAGFLARWSALWRRIAPNPFLSELLSQAVRIIVIAIGVVIALNLLGASKFISTILGGAGVLGIAIGFAVRDSLENYISSIMLSLRQPFRAQDHVQINQHEGIVVRLTSRATILMTLDGNHLRIPNSIVFKGIILNYSTNPERRFEFVLGVDGADDPLAAMQVGLTEINKHESILSEPGAGASIDSVGDSSIIIKFTGWVDQAQSDFVKARSVAIAAAKNALETNGFTLPEPIYRLRFDETANGLPLGIIDTSAAEDKKAESINNKPVEDKPKAVKTMVDVSVNEHLQEKVNQERAKDTESDLLDQSQPTE
jgi:small-conductance mechanosensitive channel